MAWDRIRGHDPILKQFRTAFDRGRMAHAYLFLGPAGVGKRLFARELAKALLCENPPASLTACDHCASCSLVAADTHPDFSSYRKLEDKNELTVEVVDDLVEKMGRKATRGLRKVIFVEDAELINDASANKFLKTLEEPPPGSLLILRANSRESQLQTILSRCQTVAFHALSADDVRSILQSQGGIDATRIERLVSMSHGSAGLAVALNSDALWQFREMLIDTLTSLPFNGATLAERWTKFVEEAGKESSLQRARTSLAVQLLMDLLRRAAGLSLGGMATTFDEDRKLQPLATRLGTDNLLKILEASLDADRHVEQRVNLPLTIEYLVDRLAMAF
ncbi:DNA polymerase III subunit delta' [soil metagenome]